MHPPPDRLPKRDLVLVGAGHTNLHLVRMWRMRPVSDVRLTLVSPFSRATYSGMLPGTLAGLYQPDEMQIDLWRLTESCGARLIVAEATGLDPAGRQVLLAGRPPIPYDVVSIGIGSVPAQRELWQAHPSLISIKPMATFLSRLDAVLAERSQSRPNQQLSVVVVGAGAGGTEITCGLASTNSPPVEGGAGGVCNKNQTLLKSTLANPRKNNIHLTLIDSHPEILTGHTPRAAKLMRQELTRRHVTILNNRRAIGFANHQLQLDDGTSIPADCVVWAAKAAAPTALANIPLPKTEEGFLAIRDTLQSTGDDRVFAVGDSATLVGNPFPKAGVYAVREGPILWENVRRLLTTLASSSDENSKATFDGPQPRTAATLVKYKPQRGFLSLLSLGDGRAILDYHGLALSGRWAWHLKDYIDRKFMRMHQNYPPRMTPAAPQASTLAQMRCAGCGGKVGADVLATALQRLNLPIDSRVRLGLETPDDAVVLNRTAAPVDVFSIDFFEAFLDDPYLVGRIAAVHALSDVYAMGAEPLGALAMVTLPSGDARSQSELLYQMLAGAVRELHAAGAGLWGGHTTEASELTMGFAVSGVLGERQPLTKRGLNPGDKLMLTKPLGSGVLLAAHRRSQCRAEWLDAMLNSMLRSNATASRLARDAGVRSATDVTGFGLLGHLLEMLAASGTSARINLGVIPLLKGFAELSQARVRSSLDPANRRVESRLQVSQESAKSAKYAALFDPQTSGGMLLGVPRQKVDDLIANLSRAGERAVIVGEVLEKQEWAVAVE